MARPDFTTILSAARARPAIASLQGAGVGRDWPPLWLVGGGVRDLVLGRVPADLDILVEGALEPILAGVDAVVERHPRFGTATVELAGERLDLARARCETYARPGALPAVEPASAAEDLHRRDFTVNAIAMRLTGPGAGSVLAASEAIGDLEAGRLRILHPESFRDDPTRMLRLARYRARLGFTVEAETADGLRAALGEGALETVSGVRVGNELRLLTREPDPVDAFVALGELGVAEAVAPGYGLGDGTVARAALRLLPADGRSDLLVAAAALLGVEPARREPLLVHLGCTGSDRARILAALRDLDSDRRLLAEAGRPSELLGGLRDAGPERVALAGALGPDTAARWWLEDLRHRRLEIGGADLLAAGVPESPSVLRGLRAAEAAMLDGDAPGREEQLAVALQAARGGEATR